MMMLLLLLLLFVHTGHHYTGPQRVCDTCFAQLTQSATAYNIEDADRYIYTCVFVCVCVFLGRRFVFSLLGFPEMLILIYFLHRFKDEIPIKLDFQNQRMESCLIWISS